ncbi:hypothetical protein Droror1_Dr00018251 [Drosera rotundifolia]
MILGLDVGNMFVGSELVNMYAKFVQMGNTHRVADCVVGDGVGFEELGLEFEAQDCDDVGLTECKRWLAVQHTRGAEVRADSDQHDNRTCSPLADDGLEVQGLIGGTRFKDDLNYNCLRWKKPALILRQGGM